MIFEAILLSIVVVFLFLGSLRSTFITVIAIPISLIGAFVFMGLFGFTINIITLMALCIAVGLVLDDAIVVRENIFRHIENGEPLKLAALRGTREVSLAIIATTLTIVAVFLSVGFMYGVIGQYFREFGLTVVFAVCISTLDAFTTAPMLSAYIPVKPHTENANPVRLFLNKLSAFSTRVFDSLLRLYELSIKYALNHKKLVLTISTIIFVFSLYLLAIIPKTFLPASDFGQFNVMIEAQPGTSLNKMKEYTTEISKKSGKKKNVRFALASIGDSYGNSNIANIFVHCKYRIAKNEQEKRDKETEEIKVFVRNLLKSYEEKNNFSVQINDTIVSRAANPFRLILTGDNLETLAAEAEELIEKLKEIPGLVDLVSNYKTGKPEFQIKLNPEKMKEFGIEAATVGMELRSMIEGIIPATYREKGMEYNIRVRLKDQQRDLNTNFESIYIPNINNQLINLKHFAEPILTVGPSKIFRKNRSRYIEISGNLTKTGAIGDITKEVKRIIEAQKLPENIEYHFAGESEELLDLFKNMKIATFLSILFIYLCLASLYESLIIPFTIMLALPLAIIGGIFALFITGMSVNIFTMMGFLFLLGIVTKNSILLVDYIQRLMRAGFKRNDAIIRAGMVRIRPILMTTCVLIAGMVPLALGTTDVGHYVKSLAFCVIGGLISSTFLTLLVIPAIFEYMDSLRLATRKFFGRPPVREIDNSDLDLKKKINSYLNLFHN